MRLVAVSSRAWQLCRRMHELTGLRQPKEQRGEASGAGMRLRVGTLAGLLLLGCSEAESSAPGDAAPSSKNGPPESVFQRERRIEVEIELAPEDWEQLRVDGRSMADILSPMPTPFRFADHAATVRVDGVVHRGTIVKKKGFIGSLSVRRPSLRIDFDPERTGLDAGLRRLTLNADVQDRSHARQCMAFDLFARAGMAASRCAFAHVVVNGVDLGTYTNVEPIYKPMLRRFWADDEGPLYEGTLADFDAESWERIELESDTSVDKPELRQLVSALEATDDTLVAALSELIDLDRFRTFWAMETLLGHWDGYAESANNYYLYFDPETERFEFIPWGLDQTFVGARPFTTTPYEISVLARAALTRRLYDLPEQRALYRQRLGELEEQFWDEASLLAAADDIERLVPDVDPVAMAAHREFLTSHGDALAAALTEPPPEIIDPALPPPPACPTPVSPISGSFSVPWANPGGSSTAEIALELDGAPVTGTFSPSAQPDANSTTGASLTFFAQFEGGRSLLVLIILPLELITPGTHPFHSFETFGLIGLTDPSNPFTTLGLIGDGSIRFDSASVETDGLITGSFQATLYQSACFGPPLAAPSPGL